LVCYGSLAIFLQGLGLQLEEYYNLAMLSIILPRVSEAAIAITLYPIMTRPVSGVRGRDIKLPLSSNIGFKIENKEYEEICLPSLTGQKWDVHRMPSTFL
jgi:hypothetical protein